MNDYLASPEKAADEISQKMASLASRLKGTEMELSSSECQNIASYLGFLSNYNQKVNLVGNCDPHLLVERHALDGLTLAAGIRRRQETGGTSSAAKSADSAETAAAKPESSDANRRRLASESGDMRAYLDIGSGGGLPAIIVALVCPELYVTMLDATAKKCHFLELAIEALSLTSRAQVITGRAEELAHEEDLRGQFDFASARAVGTLKVTSELIVPFLRPGGVFLAQKTLSRLPAEIAESKALLEKIGASLEETETVGPYEELREAVIVPVKKVRATPALYPREWKLINSAK